MYLLNFLAAISGVSCLFPAYGDQQCIPSCKKINALSSNARAQSVVPIQYDLGTYHVCCFPVHFRCVDGEYRYYSQTTSLFPAFLVWFCRN